MLLTKTVKIKWNSRNKKWYVNKNYKYTKMGDEFEVKVEDLTEGSGALVEVKCDCKDCKTPYLKPMMWKDYKRYVHKDGKYYCYTCNIRLKAKDILKTRLINGYSFAQWGIDNIGEDFLEKYWDYEKNDELGINPLEIGCGYRKHKIWIKCQKKDYHGSYETTCNTFMQKIRCPYCRRNSGKVHPLDSLGKILEDKGLLGIWSDKNKKSPYGYAPHSMQKVWWKCLNGKHKDYLRKISDSFRCDFRCSGCVAERDESFLQEKVRLCLESLNNGEYTILHEHNCTIIPHNPKIHNNRGQLPFDNEIKELKLIIEVNGSQHYKELSGKWFNKNFDLHHQKLLDRYKRMYAKSQGYEYLEIPFWTDNAKEEWKWLINNKIKEIIKKQEVA